jgi:uncharacterized protein DUF6962
LFRGGSDEKIDEMSPEVAVAISDFLLAGFSGALAFRLQSRPTEIPRTRRWFAIVLWAIAISSFLGAISHGFIPEEHGSLGALIWRSTLMLIGPAAVGLCMLACLLLFRPATVERARLLALILLGVYVGLVLFEYHEFVIALLLYLPATLLLLAGFVVRWRQGQPFAADGALAMVLTLVAGLLQYLRVDVHPVYFNHNALYHVIQGMALFFLYRAGRKWISATLPATAAIPLEAHRAS